MELLAGLIATNQIIVSPTPHSLQRVKNGENMAKMNFGTLLVAALVIGLVAVGTGVVSLPTQLSAVQGPGIPGIPSANVSGVDYRQYCGDDTQVTPRFTLQNTLDTATRTYATGSVLIYRIENGGEMFVTEGDWGPSGTAPTVTLDCGNNYAAYLTSNGTYNSFRGVVDLSTASGINANKNEVGFKDAYAHDVLFFKVYSHKDSAYRYGVAGNVTDPLATANTWSTTASNSSPITIGANGYVDDTIEVSMDGSPGNTIFNDIDLVFGLNANTTEYDTDSATLTVPAGATAQRFTECSAVSSRLSDDSYDTCWVIKGAGVPESGSANFRIYFKTVADINPAGNVTWTFATNGMYRGNDNSIKTGYQDDAASPAYVQALQTGTWNLG